MIHFAKGDRVAYSAKFLNSICDYSADSANMRGTIIEAKNCGKVGVVLSIKWDGEDRDSGGLAGNFVHADRIHLEPR